MIVIGDTRLFSVEKKKSQEKIIKRRVMNVHITFHSSTPKTTDSAKQMTPTTLNYDMASPNMDYGSFNQNESIFLLALLHFNIY